MANRRRAVFGERLLPIARVAVPWVLALLFLERFLLRGYRVDGLVIALGTDVVGSLANQYYLLSAIAGMVATLIISAVIAVAPLLSLSLHQSYDAFYQLGEALARRHGPATSEPAEDQPVANPWTAFMEDSRERLERTYRTYKVLDLFYYAIWIASCLLLLITIIRLVYYEWHDADTYRSLVTCLILAVVNSLAFGILSLVYFLRARPGLNKLELILKYYYNCTTTPAEEENPMRKLTPREIGVLVLLVGLLAVALFYSTRRPSSELPALKVGVNSLAIASAPAFRVSVDSVADGRVAVKEVPFASGRLALDALIGGQVDVATVAETPIVVASREHKDLRIIHTLTISPLRIVGRRSSGITDLPSLAGKRFAALLGTSSEFFLSRVLARHSLTAPSPINLQPPDMISALQKGEVDAIAIWEPFAQRAIENLGPDAVVFEDTESYIEYFNLVTTEDALSQGRRKLQISRYVEELKRAAGELAGNQDASITLVASRVSLATDEITKVWPRFRFPATMEVAPLLQMMENVERWDAGRIPTSPRSAADLRMLIQPIEE